MTQCEDCKQEILTTHVGHMAECLGWHKRRLAEAKKDLDEAVQMLKDSADSEAALSEKLDEAEKKRDELLRVIAEWKEEKEKQ